MGTFLIRFVSESGHELGRYEGLFADAHHAVMYGSSVAPDGTVNIHVEEIIEEQVLSMLEEIESYMHTVTTFLDETSAVDFTTFLSYICLILEQRCEAEELDVIEIAEKLYLNIKKMNERDRR